MPKYQIVLKIINHKIAKKILFLTVMIANMVKKKTRIKWHEMKRW